MKLEKNRRDYGKEGLNSEDLNDLPAKQLELWVADAVNSNELDPTAMVVSTVDASGMPDSRVLLLKEIKNETLIFYSNYDSSKGKQLVDNCNVALNFYWPSMVRQVRVRGSVKKLARADSEKYFNTRPLDSRVAAIISKQSAVLESKDSLYTEYENAIAEKTNTTCPENWGGYVVIPVEFEFYKGRTNRLSDRVHYHKVVNTWVKSYLYP